ncbi:MAG: hypothetical protein H3C58_04585 [Fimbriimonadaceae bacterium]|nr:hypothetical protein [Fimbriimonadaceae bacterium]
MRTPLLVIAAILTTSVVQAQMSLGWTTRSNGPANGNDTARSVLVAPDGGAIVGGSSQGSGTGLDFWIVRYGPTGTVAWTYRYNGTGNGEDQIVAMGADNAGNIYAVGHSLGASTGFDFALVKLNASGGEQWVRRYSGTSTVGADLPRALHVEPATGVCHVAGSVSTLGSDNFAVIKVLANGSLAWDFHFDRAGLADSAAAVKTDAAGNVYATGYSTASTSRDMTTVKLTPGGGLDRLAYYNNPSLSAADEAFDLVADDQGRVTITGYSAQTSILEDMMTIRYDASFNTVWTARYNGTGGTNDAAYGIARDPYGNVIVVGESVGVNSGYDLVAVSYGPTGTQRYVSRYNGPGNREDVATAVAFDPVGNAFVAGYSFGSGTFLDFVLVKFDAALAQQYVFRYNGPVSADDAATSVAVDRFGRVAVTGWSNGSGSARDFATQMYGQSAPLGGTVTLQDFAGSRNGQPVTVSVGPLDLAATWSGDATLDGAGKFTRSVPYTGLVDVRVKASHWLALRVPGVAVHPVNGAEIAASLVNGDVNGDNSINATDFILLRSAYGSTASSANWNANADLDGNGSVNLQDFLILRKNFGRTGD